MNGEEDNKEKQSDQLEYGQKETKIKKVKKRASKKKNKTNL